MKKPVVVNFNGYRFSVGTRVITLDGPGVVKKIDTGNDPYPLRIFCYNNDREDLYNPSEIIQPGLTDLPNYLKIRVGSLFVYKKDPSCSVRIINKLISSDFTESGATDALFSVPSVDVESNGFDFNFYTINLGELYGYYKPNLSTVLTNSHDSNDNGEWSKFLDWKD